MAIVAIELVRSKFEPGDSPKGSDYLDLIDSLAALPDISGKQDVVANVSSTEIGYLDGVTSAIQTQLDAKAPTASPTFTGTVTIPSGSAITGVPYLATANTFTGGVQQITTASAATVGVIVKATASQTANLQEWQNSTGTVLANVSSSGQFLTPRLTITNGGNIVDSAGTTPYFGFGSNQIAIYARNAAYKPLIIQGHTSQTVSLTEWQNSAGNVLAFISTIGGFGSSATVRGSAGGIFGGATQLSSAGLTVYAPAAATIGAIIRGAASQTANLQEWQDSAGTALINVTSAGYINIGRSTTLGSAAITVQNAPVFTHFNTNNAAINVIAANFLRGNTVGNAMYLGQLGDAANGVAAISFLNTSTTQVFSIGQTGSLVSTLSNAASIGLIVKAAASQTANLQEWQNSAGTVLASVNASGKLSSTLPSGTFGHVLSLGANGAADLIKIGYTSGGVSYLIPSIYGQFQIQLPIATAGFAVKGFASQTADLQQWQNSAGTVLGRVASNGVIKANVGLVAENNTSGNYTALQVNSYVASGVGAIIVGAASQTADLQQWMNSAGTVLTYVRNDGLIHTSAGILTTSSFIGSNGYIADTQLSSTARAATVIGAVIRGAASQTANLQEWQNSAGTVIAKVNSSGNIVAGDMAIATSSVSTIHISNGTIPSADPTGGGVLYVEAGALKFRGSSGTVTTIAVA